MGQLGVLSKYGRCKTIYANNKTIVVSRYCTYIITTMALQLGKCKYSYENSLCY